MRVGVGINVGEWGGGVWVEGFGQMQMGEKWEGGLIWIDSDCEEVMSKAET